jgi:hypothetical protein
MKAKHFFCYLAVVAVLFTACKKDKDYRDKWVGNWDFTTIDYHKDGVVGPFIEETDTTYFIGTIEKHGTNRLKITFKPNALEPDFTEIVYPLRVNGLIYPIVCNLGDFDYPEFRCDKGGFSGCISGNQINIYYQQSAGHFGNESHTIQGIKINK